VFSTSTIEFFNEQTLNNLFASEGINEIDVRLDNENGVIKRRLPNPAGVLSIGDKKENKIYSDFIKIHSEPVGNDLDDKITLFPFLLKETVSSNTFIWITNMDEEDKVKALQEAFVTFSVTKTTNKLKKNNIEVNFSNDLNKGFALINKNSFEFDLNKNIKVDGPIVNPAIKKAEAITIGYGINFILYDAKNKVIEFYSTLGADSFNEYFKFRYFVSALRNINDFEFLYDYKYKNKFEKEIKKVWHFTLVNMKSIMNNPVQVFPLGSFPIGTVEVEDQTFVIMDNMLLKYPYIRKPIIISTYPITGKDTYAYILPWTFTYTPIGLPNIVSPGIEKLDAKTKKEILYRLVRNDVVKYIEQTSCPKIAKGHIDI